MSYFLVGSMLLTVYTFGPKIIQLALLFSYLRWTVLSSYYVDIVMGTFFISVQCKCKMIIAYHNTLYIVHIANCVMSEIYRYIYPSIFVYMRGVFQTV